MTDTLLAFATQYGLYVVATIVYLAAIGIPLPSSLVVLTSGGLAAADDLSFSYLLLVTLFAFVLGDQTAYQVGRMVGPRLVDTLDSYARLSAPLHKSEQLYKRYGLLAVFLTRTIFSPCGPYVAYFSGAWSMHRTRFAQAAISGALVWTLFYASIGYLFAGQIPAISDLALSLLLVSVALFCAVGFGIKLMFAWRAFVKTAELVN